MFNLQIILKINCKLNQIKKCFFIKAHDVRINLIDMSTINVNNTIQCGSISTISSTYLFGDWRNVLWKRQNLTSTLLFEMIVVKKASEFKKRIKKYGYLKIETFMVKTELADKKIKAKLSIFVDITGSIQNLPAVY